MGVAAHTSWMHYLKLFLLLAVLCTGAANADVWKWVDANGKTHYVDSNKSIYTWRDDSGRVFYSDKKDHDDAVLVQLVWHSSGSIAQMEEEPDNRLYAFEGETEQQRLAREAAEAHHCKRAKEIYDSYLNAPKLYVTNADGEKEFLSEEEVAATIAETKVKVDELCK